MKMNRTRAPFVVASTSATLLGTIAILGLSAIGCGGSSGGAGSGGAAGQSALGGHGGVPGASGGAAGGSSGSWGGAVGGGGAGPAGQSGTAGVGGSAGGAVSSGGAGGRVAGTGGTGAGGGAAAATGGAGGAGGKAAATGGAGGSSSGPGKVGVVALTETVTSFTAPAPVGTITIVASGAAASYGVTSSANSGCQTTTVGSCQLFTNCPTSSSTSTLVNAGSVTVTGLATSPIALGTLSATGGYISTAYSTYLWTTSVPATVTVSGSADVPAYTMTVPTATPITITAPATTGTGSSGSTYAFAKATDLVVSWTGGAVGQVTVSVESMGTTPGANVTCTSAALAGTLRVPASLMSGLGTMGAFSASVTSFNTMNVGDWLMDFQATVGVASGTVTFSN